MKFKYIEPDFDPQNYPIEDVHKQTIEKIEKLLGIAVDQQWNYQATIHGRVFETPSKITRIHLQDIQFFANLNGLRWIEIRNEMFVVGIEHKY